MGKQHLSPGRSVWGRRGEGASQATGSGKSDTTGETGSCRCGKTGVPTAGERAWKATGAGVGEALRRTLPFARLAGPVGRLSRRHPRSSPAQSKSINESINHPPPTDTASRPANEPTNHPTHHPSRINPTGHRGKPPGAASAMQHSAAHAPGRAGRRAGTQSPASICNPVDNQRDLLPPQTSPPGPSCGTLVS